MSQHMSAMNVSYLEALKSKHAALSDEVEQNQKYRASCQFYLRQLKKQKLKLKEEIENIKKRTAKSA